MISLSEADMNYKLMGKFLSQILFVEAVFMLPALIIGICDRSIPAVRGFVAAIALTAAD